MDKAVVYFDSRTVSALSCAIGESVILKNEYVQKGMYEQAETCGRNISVLNILKQQLLCALRQEPVTLPR